MNEHQQTLAARYSLKAEEVGFANVKAAVESTDEKARTFTARITSERIDRDREVLVCDGMDGTEFLKTGATVFWNHNYDLPIAAGLELTKAHDHWMSKARVASRPPDFQGDFFPDYAWAMISQGIVRGISVGFMPVEWRDPGVKDFETYGKDVERVISKWRLLEWSIAPLQSNIDALVVAVNKGLIAPEMARKLAPDTKFEPVPPPKPRKVVIVSIIPVAPRVDKAARAKVIERAVKDAVARARGQIYA